MRINPIKPERKPTRLAGFDYSLAGAYFITLVTYHRDCLFGTIAGGHFQPNKYAKLVRRVWIDLPTHYPQISLGEFVIMPNHVHGIVMITDINTEGTTIPGGSRLNYGLSEFVRAFKSFSARRINYMRRLSGIPVWQRSFYDRIIRSELELAEISEYIQANPTNWLDDELQNSV